MTELAYDAGPAVRGPCFVPRHWVGVERPFILRLGLSRPHSCFARPTSRRSGCKYAERNHGINH